MEFKRPRVVTARGALAHELKGYLGDTVDPDSYWERLVKYIPAEVAGAYVVLRGVIGEGTGATLLPWLAMLACLLLSPIYMYISTHRHGEETPWFQIIAAPFAFVAWAVALGEPFGIAPTTGSVVLILTAMSIPAIDKVLDIKSANNR